MPRRVSLPGAEELFRGIPPKPTAADRVDAAAAPAGIDDGDQSDHPRAEDTSPAPDHASAEAHDASPRAERTSPRAEPTSPRIEPTSPAPVEGRSSTSSDRGAASSDRGAGNFDQTAVDADGAGADQDGDGSGRNRRRGSGRVRHDEKITVYVSRDELLGLERARLSLRAEYGMAVDRGRIVREALAMVLDDLAENGEESDLARRLTQP